MLVCDVHAVAILNVVLCHLLFVSAASGDHLVEASLGKGLVMTLYVVSFLSLCFPMLLR